LLLAACRSPSDPAGGERLVVFAAASLTDAFSEIGRQFEAAHPGLTVVFNFAGSQQLAHQISQGAPADVFASADEQQMAVVIESGLIETGVPQRFAGNRLVIGLPPGNPNGLTAVADLARPGLRLVLAVPEVPAGNYAQLFLEQAAADPAFGPVFRQAVLDNVVSYEQNVRTVLSKIVLGEADAGIVYQSDLSGLEEPAYLDIPGELNVLAAYPIARLTGSSRPEMAAAFVAFVLSPAGQHVLADYGFLPASANDSSGTMPLAFPASR
jgi:molybdate transport system substrate-binding protein